MNAILFDIDGTLIQTGGAGRAALDAALLDVFSIPEGTKGVTLSGRTDTGIRTEVFQKHQIEDSPENRARFLAAYLEHLPRLLVQRRGAVLPGITTLLHELSRLPNALLGLLTGNVREGARLKLEHFDLYHHFAFGGFGDDHCHRDDVARCALAALHVHHRSAVDPDRIWVIGDTPSDIRCARAVGARAVAVATGEYSYEQLQAEDPDLLFADLADAEELLEMIGKNSATSFDRC